jgi:long-subunit fatty acid transport protein
MRYFPNTGGIMKGYRIISLLFIFIFTSLSFVFSQTDEELYQGFQFQFTTPGARAMAMGGAFIALADDTSSAFFNPAGLVNLDKPQFTAEFKLDSIITPRAAGWNSFTTGALTEFSDDIVSPSFGSFAYPFGNITAAISVTNTISYYEEFALEARLLPGTTDVLNPAKGILDLEGYTFAISAALKLNDFWAFGASVGVSLAKLATTNSILAANPSDYSNISGAVINETVVNGSDTGIFFNLGFLFTPSQTFRLGVSFNHYPPMTYSQDLYISGTQVTGLHFNTIEINFDAPDRFGAGLMWNPLERLTFTVDGILMLYSQITDVMVASNDYSTLGIERGENISDLFEHKDKLEIHAGLEYMVTTGENPFCLRAGIFTIAEHRAVFKGTDPAISYRWNPADYSGQIQETVFGFTGGLGFSLSDSISINAAYVMTDYYQQGLLSATLKF